MKLLSEYIDYLEKNGYTFDSEENFCGYVDNVAYSKNDCQVVLFLRETPEFADFLDKLGDGEYEVDYKNYIVTGAAIESTITTESNFFDGSKGCIYLAETPGNYHSHGLELFEYCLSLQGRYNLEHEQKIMEAHIRNLKWASENLIPVLLAADYSVSYSSLFDVVNTDRESSDLDITFSHPNDTLYSFSMYTDCITGEAKFSDDLDLYGKTKEEVRAIMLEKAWKEEIDVPGCPGKFTYLYRDNEDITSYRKFMEEAFEKYNKEH